MAEYRIAASLYQLVNSEPASGSDGQLIYNESTGELKIWIGGSWVLIQTGTAAEVANLLAEDGSHLLTQAGGYLLTQG